MKLEPDQDLVEAFRRLCLAAAARKKLIGAARQGRVVEIRNLEGGHSVFMVPGDVLDDQEAEALGLCLARWPGVAKKGADHAG